MTTIKIKKGAGTPSGLTFGELAYDVTNKKLFIGITGGNALLANTDGGVASFNGLTGGVTLAAGTNITLTPLGNTITIASSGGDGAVSSVSGSGTGISVSPTTGAVIIQNTGVHSFNGLTGAVSGVTTGTTNTFGPLQSFTSGISSAGGTFSSRTIFLAGITVAGGATFGTDISVFGVKVGRGNQGATNGGDTNLAVGANTLNVVVPNPASFAGVYNLAFGTSALQNTTSGGYNSAFGTEALLSNTSGGGNIAFGIHALRLNTSGAENCAFGGGPMYQNTTGGYNVAIGSLSYYYKSTGSYNVAIGFQAGYNFGTPRSGSTVTSATNCTLIGSYATPLSSGTTNEIVIGYDAIGKGSNTVSIGNSSITATHLTGIVNNPSGLSAAGATFSGDIAVNGGDITTTSATATLYNTTATTVNIGNAASTVNLMGATANTQTGIGSMCYVKTGQTLTTSTAKQEIFRYPTVTGSNGDRFFADIIITANYGGGIAGSISSQITKMLVATSYNTAINHTEYGNVNTFGNLAVYTAEISGDNVIIYATPTSSSAGFPTVFNTYATLIKGSYGANTEE